MEVQGQVTGWHSIQQKLDDAVCSINRTFDWLGQENIFDAYSRRELAYAGRLLAEASEFLNMQEKVVRVMLRAKEVRL